MQKLGILKIVVFLILYKNLKKLYSNFFNAHHVLIINTVRIF